MLGELIGEDVGAVTVRRVLPSSGAGPEVEVSFQSTGKLLGIEMTNMGTYVSAMRPDGTLFGGGQGVVMGAQGATATWKGQGVGRFNPDGSISFRGAIYYESNSPQWSRLNSVAAVYEHEIGADGAIKDKTWEWK